MSIRKRTNETVCDFCDKVIKRNERYFTSEYGTHLCNDCGDIYLSDNEDYGYIYNEYDSEVIYDDEGVDLEVFWEEEK